jgi:glycine/D-amino acid oxidase-like deaminating enzyme
MSGQKVFVVGGGWLGVNAATQLARRGCVVTLFERETALMMETSSRSTECFRLAWADPTMRAFVGRSIELLERDAFKHRVPLEKRGYLFLSSDEAQQRALAASFSDERSPLREHSQDLSKYDSTAFSGVDLLLGSETINRAFPVAAGNIAHGREMYGVHMRRGGWFNSALLAQCLASELQDVRVCSRVDDLVMDSRRDRVCGVKLHSGDTVEGADAVVLAIGPSFPGFVTQRNLLPAPVPLINEIHAHCLFHNTSVPESLPLTFYGHAPGPLPWSEEQRRDIAQLPSREDREVLLHETLPQGLHFRKLPDNTLDSIWTWERALDKEPPSFVPRVPAWYGAASLGCLAAYWPEHFLEAARQVSFKRGRILVPSLKRVIAGNYTMTPENRPIVGPLKAKGLFALGAFSGFGMMSAPAAGELIADHVVGRQLPPYEGAFLLSRYSDKLYLDNMHRIVSGKL